MPITLAICHRSAWLALPVITAPLAWLRLRQLVTAASGPVFNRLLAATAQLVLVHGLLFSAGLIAS